MRYRVIFPGTKYFPCFFRTKKEAIACQAVRGGEIQRKIGGGWFGY